MKNTATKSTFERRLGLAVTGLSPFVRLDATAPRFKKEVLRKGKWVHQGTGEKLDFDVALLERLAQDTNKWITLGQKVHFPVGPDCHEEDARDALQNLGYWSNFRVEGERLVADVEVLDQQAVDKIGKTIQDVSPEIRWPARAATGEVLEAAIFHVAATPIPAIPGQSNFERLSQLAREVSMGTDAAPAPASAPENKPASTSGGVNLMTWARQKLGLPADATEEAVLTALEQRIDAAAQAPASAAAEGGVLTQLTREVKDAREEAQAAKKLVAELREQKTQEKKKRDEEAVQLARQTSADAGLPIPEDTCKLALALFAKDEDHAARELLSAYTARANDRRITSARTFESKPDATAEGKVALSQEAAEKLLLERDGWTVKTRKDGSIKRDANGRPKLVRRDQGKE
jgi:hypothetical protein